MQSQLRQLRLRGVLDEVIVHVIFSQPNQSPINLL
jgi:hypothetical protein